MSHFTTARWRTLPRAGAGFSPRQGSGRARTAVLLALGLAWGALVTPALAAAKGSKYYQQARGAELNKEYDQSLELYERALKEDPENQTYIMATRRLRFVAGQWHVDLGHKLLEQGRLEEAAADFEKAVGIDPASSIAEQELRRTREQILERQKRQKKGQPAQPGEAEAPTDEQGLSPVAAARKQTEALFDRALRIPTLKPLSTQPINLKATNSSKVIFETVGKLAGVNVLFDPDYQDRRFTLELNNATLYEALDYISTLAKAYWKPLSANAIFVTNDNTTKRRDYEDYVVKTFYLANVYTAQELQEIATMVRSVTDIRRVVAINSLNALVIRASADSLALAEKVMADIDKSRSEVIIDVLVLESSQSRTRELGITPVSGSTPGINIPIAFAPGGAPRPAPTSTTTDPTTGGTIPTTGGTTGSGSLALSQLGRVGTGDFSLNLPGASIKALMSRSDTRVLQSPRVRGFDGYKASLRIGDRIPIATGSFQPGIGGVGINPLVNTQFNYQDVGVVLDLTPKVHLGKEVSMHVEMEISNVRDRIDIGGISQPIIGQRKVIHDIRLKEGEGSIIGGLMQSQTTRAVSGVPLLGQIPVLRWLFSSERLEKSENEILIVLLPHVVRVPDLTALNLRGIATGTDQTVKVSFAPEPNDHPALPPAPAPATAPATPPAPPAATPAVPPPAPAPAASGALLRFDRVQVSEPAGARITLNLVAENMTDLFAAPLRVTWDAKIVSLADARRGAMLASDGQDIIFSKNVQNDIGEASINLSRFPGSGGVSGAGVLLVLEFQGQVAGKSTITISGLAARNAKLESIPLGNVQAEIVVR